MPSKAAHSRYNKSPKGKERWRRYYYKNRAKRLYRRAIERDGGIEIKPVSQKFTLNLTK